MYSCRYVYCGKSPENGQIFHFRLYTKQKKKIKKMLEHKNFFFILFQQTSTPNTSNNHFGLQFKKKE